MVKHTQTIRLFLSVLGHLTSTILAILSTKLHCHFLQQQQLQALNKNVSYESQVLLNKESQLVGEKHRNIQWKDLNSTFRSSSFTERCFTHRLEGIPGRYENWRDMNSAGEKDAHKRTRTSCIKTSTGNLFESTGNRVTAYSDGQYIIYNRDVLSKNGGHKTFTNGLSFQANLVL